MNKSIILSGDHLVGRGTTTKSDVTLPEVGLKDVTPNGSWLEQKQIQTALEARKQLIEVERIEKRCVLSRAEWREELMLAEVIQQVGGYWQYLGHNVGKRLYLKPEEALFLMELNCLQLMYNEVTVSLQQAYSLLLRGKISIIHYKVYASLSRLGYKIFRHDDSKHTDYEKKINIAPYTKNTNKNLNHATQNNRQFVANENETIVNDEKEETPNIEKVEQENPENEENNENNKENNKNSTEKINSDPNTKEVLGKNSNDQSNIMENVSNEHESSNTEIIFTSMTNITNERRYDDKHSSKNTLIKRQSKLQKLKNRKAKTNFIKDVHKYFENIPELCQKHVVTVNVPQESYIPENIVFNTSSYVLKLDNITTKTKSSTTESRTYSIMDEVNGAHVRRVRSSSANDINFIPPFYSNSRVGRQNPQFRMFNFWRPRPDFNFYQFNLIFQRPFLPNLFSFNPRFNFFPRTPTIFLRNFTNFANFNENRNMPNDNRKRTRDNAKNVHLQSIKNLTMRLKQLFLSGNRQEANVTSLQRLIQTYNVRYKTKLRLTEQFDLVEDEIVLETIELDDDEEPNKKKARSDNNSDAFNENLNRLRQLSLKLKDLEAKNITSSRHRRSFSNLIKTFNKSFNADVYMNGNYEMVDRRHITLESSSDSDCIIEETPVAESGGKKLRNPFNILKRLSEKHNIVNNAPSTSKETWTEKVQDKDEDDMPVQSGKYCELVLNTFNKNWLPDENDFGKAEVPHRDCMINSVIDDEKEQFLYDFIRNHPYNFKNWLEAKIAFWKNLQETTAAFQSEPIDNSGVNSIVTPEDCTDMPSVLKKLSIIQTNMEIDSESVINIDFDVYNRDVQNFRKSNRPKPHFRVICMNECASMPTGAEIATLHSKYNDNIAIVFAVVSTGAVSYLQMNPSNLPVYIPSNEMP